MILCNKSIEEIEEIAKEESKQPPLDDLSISPLSKFKSADDIDANFKDNVADYFTDRNSGSKIVRHSNDFCMISKKMANRVNEMENEYLEHEEVFEKFERSTSDIHITPTRGCFVYK